MNSQLKLLIIGFAFFVVGSILVVNSVGWSLWFGIIFMIAGNNVNVRLREMEAKEVGYYIKEGLKDDE